MTAAALAALMQRRAGAIERELRAATRQLGALALATSRRRLSEDIYAKPIPRRPKSGKPQWKRTGALRRAEGLRVDTTGYQVTLVNEMSYAEPRHEAGKPGRRKTTRPAHWRDETIAALSGRAGELCRQAINRALRG